MRALMGLILEFGDVMSITVRTQKTQMNRTIIAIALILVVRIHAFGQSQGVFELSNVATSPDRHIYVGDYMGATKAEGSAYQIAIFWGPSGATDENALVQLGSSIGFLTGGGAGQFSGGTKTIFDPGGSSDGGVFTFQARAWDASTGATWGAAAANPAGRIGKGPVFQMKTKDPFDLLEGTPRIGDAAGWRGFAIAVPEPSTWVLAALGMSTLVVMGMRKR